MCLLVSIEDPSYMYVDLQPYFSFSSSFSFFLLLGKRYPDIRILNLNLSTTCSTAVLNLVDSTSSYFEVPVVNLGRSAACSPTVVLPKY